MKKLVQWMLAATQPLVLTMVLCGSTAKAQTAADSTYVMPDEYADAGYFMPAPPDSMSLAFADDLLQWQWGKSMRTTERGQRASREAVVKPSAICAWMAEILQLDAINDDATPALSRLVLKARSTGINSPSSAKLRFGRTRPFALMNEQPWAPSDTIVNPHFSYPSGHTATGWALALVMAEMWPALQDTILRRGFEYGENRVIVGAHWQSDVASGYLCGAAAIARAHANPALEADISAAREEYARLKGLSVPDEGYPVPEDYAVGVGGMPRGERILNAPVDTASYRYIGEYMRYRQAFALRETERGDQAVAEGDKTMAHFAEIFGGAMGITVSETETPAIWQLILAARTASSRAATTLKDVKFRKRPFVQTGEATAIPEEEPSHVMSSSYPSAHSCMSWGIALTLAEMVPEHQDEILRRGYEFGYSRLIVGYHWGTDIDDARLLASATVARQHADPQFRQLIAAARQEYEGLVTPVLPVALPYLYSTETSAHGQASDLRLDGIPATAATRGIVIENNKKTIKQR
jgi:acid phosphatase (class A)